MTLILFPLRSEYTVATHTAVLSLLASWCDGVPRFAGHTSTHTPPHTQVFDPFDLHLSGCERRFDVNDLRLE